MSPFSALVVAGQRGKVKADASHFARNVGSVAKLFLRRRVVCARREQPTYRNKKRKSSRDIHTYPCHKQSFHLQDAKVAVCPQSFADGVPTASPSHVANSDVQIEAAHREPQTLLPVTTCRRGQEILLDTPPSSISQLI